jgi:hypothetical protein
MIRSCSIPPVLNRICDDTIHSALLVTTDGELMGSSTKNSNRIKDPQALGTLLADVGVDYMRLGEEYAGVDEVQRSKSHLQCLLIEMECGLVGIAACLGIDCLVIAVANPDAPPGLVKARLQALAAHVQESLSTLAETT